jgi:CarD family transcriptional regulator
LCQASWNKGFRRDRETLDGLAGLSFSTFFSIIKGSATLFHDNRAWFFNTFEEEDIVVGFRVGEKVVYPNHGVSVVEKIGEGFATEPTRPRSFYHLRLLSNNSKVMVPIGNTDLIGLRRLTQRKDITGLMKRLADYRFSASGDWKGRYKQNLDKMKSGRLHDIADVLKSLNYIMSRKTLSFREKKMYERAKYLIVSEIAVINGLDEPEVERQVDRALFKSAQGRAAH